MGKYSFTAAQRSAIYVKHGEKCYMCTSPIDLKSMQIDHIIPESLLADKDQLSSVLNDFGLPSDFDLNGYGNWLPSCATCNRKKSAKVFTPSPIIQIEIESAINKADEVAELAQKTVSNRELSKAINTLDRAKESGGISEEFKMSLQPIIDYLLKERNPDALYEDIKLSPYYEISPGRRHIVQEITKYMGLDFIILSPPKSIILSFDKLYEQTKQYGMHPLLPINAGAMTGLRSVGIINDDNKLTSLGITVFKASASAQVQKI